MAHFRQLASLTVEHAFFAPRPCRALQFQPVAVTAAELASTGCAFRRLEAGFEIYCDPTAAALRLQLASAQQWRLTFLGTSNDPHWASYTAGTNGLDQPLGFEQWDETGSTRCLRAASPDSRAGSWQPGLAPICTVTLSIDADTLQRAPISYVLPLAARTTRWKYYFTGDWLSHPLRIVDAAGLLQFLPTHTEQLSDGRNAQVIVSQAEIALHARPQQRLALRSAQGAIDKVLIKRLPLASPAHLARESIDAMTTWVAEIYVAA